MVSQDENITCIEFPRPITQDEAPHLMRHLAEELEAEIEVSYARTERYGDRYERKKEAEKIISTRVNEREINGQIYKIHPELKSAAFNLKRTFDGLDRAVYVGIEFFVTPDTTPGELPSCDDPQIMRDTKTAVVDYFNYTAAVR